MYTVDFVHSHISQAEELALIAFREEREIVSALPPCVSTPALTSFADNGLGVAAFHEEKMVGFLCGCPPFPHAFDATDVVGVFSPMGANAAAPENRAKIYASMYQAAAAKWVRAGAVSHGICLYAHDEEAQRQFYQYGFGLRCMDAIRPMEPIACALCEGYNLVELSVTEYPSVYPLEVALHRHYRESPFLMNRTPDTLEEFAASCRTEGARYFGAKQNGNLCAFLKIADSGETFAANGPGYRHINGAYCLPAHRGKGVYQNLLNVVIAALKEEGYTRLGVDFESLNPTAYGFWLKYFKAYTHGVVRRIDERILTLA